MKVCVEKGRAGEGERCTYRNTEIVGGRETDILRIEINRKIESEKVEEEIEFNPSGIHSLFP